MNIEAIADFLQDQGVGSVGRTIFCYHIPSEVTKGILIRDRLQGDREDHETGLMNGGFQLIARAKTHPEAKALAKEAVQALRLDHVTVEDMQIKFLRNRGEPVTFPVSDGRLIECLVIFDSIYSYQ